MFAVQSVIDFGAPFVRPDRLTHASVCVARNYITGWGASLVVNRFLKEAYLDDTSTSIDPLKSEDSVNAKTTFATMALFRSPAGHAVKKLHLKFTGKPLSIVGFGFGNCELRKYGGKRLPWKGYRVTWQNKRLRDSTRRKLRRVWDPQWASYC